jgi:choloylglycine hydrolase
MRRVARVVHASLLVAIVSTACVSAERVEACTTFLLTAGGRHYVGKSYDWNVGSGHLLLNRRGVAKRALTISPRDRPAAWVSKHASMTFNQYGREMPNGGINDAGLVVEVMWLDETLYPPVDSRPSVNQLQWIQYQLDRFATVGEVVKHAGEIRPHLIYGKVHYLACDRTGACAAFEYLGGRLVVSAGASMTAKALTNSTYADSARALRRRAGFGGSEPIPAGAGSTDRFVRVAHLARGEVGGDPVVRAFAILDSVRMRGASFATQWQIVYDLQRLRAHWRSLGGWETKSATLDGAGPGCEREVTWFDLESQARGDVTGRLRRWSVADNQALIGRSMRSILASLPPGAAALVASYPAHLRCTLGGR